MNILYVGDVMGEAGIKLVESELQKLRQQEQIDFVVAQSENVTEGKGINNADFKRLRNAGVDFCTGGNWSLYREEIFPALTDPNQPIIRPANYPDGTPGLGYKIVDTQKGRILVVSLLGKIVGRDSEKEVENPLNVIDKILEQQTEKPAATIVNFHGDFSSEKIVIGHYLDGRVSMVVGDHWHVPTADAGVLPKGTAHMTDVGMCGSLDSSLGISFDSVIPRWKEGKQTRNELETSGRMQFNSILASIGENGLAESVKYIRIIKY